MSGDVTNTDDTLLQAVSTFSLPYDSLSLHIGGVEYYGSLKKSLEQANTCILICGWTFSLSTVLDKEDTTVKDVLFALPPSVEVKILIWDYPLIYTPDRDPFTALTLALENKSNISFQRFDFHPIMSSLHSKLVVIDNRLAYVGGFDIDHERLDGPYHLDDDPLRVNADGESYRPFRDYALRIQGDVSHLSDYFYQLWNSQKKQKSFFANVEGQLDLGTEFLELARTVPAFKNQAKDFSSYKLQRQLIKNAKKYIYIENQYLSHEGMVGLLCEKLASPHGPQVVIVVSYGKMPWLEKISMGSLLNESVKGLMEADRYGRLGLYCLKYRPTNDEDSFVKVHSKCMIIDGEYLKIGSSNFSKRSMEFDYEIDLFLHHSHQVKKFEKRIFKTLLSAPDCDFCEKSSLLETFEHYRKKYKKIYPLGQLIDEVSSLVEYKEYLPLDKYKMTFFEKVGQKFINKESIQTLNLKAFLVLLFLILIAGLALFFPFDQVEKLVKDYVFTKQMSGTMSLALMLFVGYVALGAFFFPLNLYILLCGAFFSPVYAFALSLCGALTAGLASYFIGAFFENVEYVENKIKSLRKLKRFLRKKSLSTIIFLRMVPIAPYSLVNFVCGKFRISLWRFVAGTLIGVAPGTFALIFMEKQLIEVFRSPSLENALYFLAAASLFYLAYRIVKKRMSA